MLNRLPTELILHVFQLAAPLDYTPSVHRERRRLLRNACLVSKGLLGVAQPLLVEVFEVRSPKHAEQLEEVEETGRTRGGARSRGVQDLRVVAVGEFRLDWLSSMSASSTFHYLVEVTFCLNNFQGDFFASFPSLDTTPSLRAFGLDVPHGCPLGNLPLNKLLQQLEALQLDHRGNPSLRNMQLVVKDATTPPALQLLILPDRLRPSLAVATAVQDLETTTEALGAELVWEYEADWACESLVSP
ncbi:hypothetical protein JCM8547_006386 [Rhodosporidiobolus lusitaniae]